MDTLHEAMIEVLRGRGWMPLEEVASEIAERALWRRPSDGAFAEGGSGATTGSAEQRPLRSSLRGPRSADPPASLSLPSLLASAAFSALPAYWPCTNVWPNAAARICQSARRNSLIGVATHHFKQGRPGMVPCDGETE